MFFENDITALLRTHSRVCVDRSVTIERGNTMIVNYYGHAFELHPRKDAPRKYVLAYNIWQAYDRPSARKVAAWHDCEQMCRDCDGHGLCITAAGCQTFSVMFDFENPVNGAPMRAHITRYYNHLYYL